MAPEVCLEDALQAPGPAPFRVRPVGHPQASVLSQGGGNKWGGVVSWSEYLGLLDNTRAVHIKAAARASWGGQAGGGRGAHKESMDGKAPEKG